MMSVAVLFSPVQKVTPLAVHLAVKSSSAVRLHPLEGRRRRSKVRISFILIFLDSLEWDGDTTLTYSTSGLGKGKLGDREVGTKLVIQAVKPDIGGVYGCPGSSLNGAIGGPASTGYSGTPAYSIRGGVELIGGTSAVGAIITGVVSYPIGGVGSVKLHIEVSGVGGGEGVVQGPRVGVEGFGIAIGGAV
jgi:hypothetical protein